MREREKERERERERERREREREQANAISIELVKSIRNQVYSNRFFYLNSDNQLIIEYFLLINQNYLSKISTFSLNWCEIGLENIKIERLKLIINKNYSKTSKTIDCNQLLIKSIEKGSIFEKF